MENRQFYLAELFFVRALLPYVAGIAFAWHVASVRWVELMFQLAVTLFAVMVFMQTFYKLLDLYNNRGFTGLVLALFLFTFGGLSCMLHQHRYHQRFFANDKFHFLKVRIIDDPQIKNNSVKCKVTVLKGYTKNGNIKPSNGNLMLYINQADRNYNNTSTYTYGSEMIIPAKCQLIEAPANPGEFDYQFYMSVQNTQHQSFLKMEEIELLSSHNENIIVKHAFKLRSHQIKYFRKILKHKESIALASTLILGSRSDLSTETIDVYSKTGTIHVLSVSGMHVGLIYIVISWMLQFFNKKKYLVILKMIIIIIIIWLYALVTGFSASVLRSAIMISAFLVAKTFNKQSNNYNILAFTAFCLLTYNPLYLWDIGFQLSFLAVLGLIGLQPSLQYSLDIKPLWLQKLWNLITTSLAAQIATFPLSIYYFHQFPVYFIISNLLIALPIVLLMYLGLMILLLKPDCLGPAFEWLIYITTDCLEWIAQLPYAGITGIWISKTELFFLSMSVILLCLAFSYRHKKMLLTGLFCLLIFKGKTIFNELNSADQQKQIDFKLSGHKANAQLNGYAALLVTDLKPTDRLFNHSIQPALDLNHIKKLRILKPDTLADKK